MKHHTKEEREEILKALESGESMSSVIVRYDVSYDSIRRWRIESGSGIEPTSRRSYTVKEKAEILIRMEEEGRTAQEAAELEGVSIETIRTWQRAKARILAAYKALGPEKASIARQSIVMKNAYTIAQPALTEDNPGMDKKEEKALRKENEYLKAKTAYLDSLLKNLGYEPSQLKKKENMKRSQTQEKKG